MSEQFGVGNWQMPNSSMMDSMMEQSQHQMASSARQHPDRIEMLEQKIDALARILFMNRDILKNGMVPDLGAPIPPVSTKRDYETLLKNKHQGDLQEEAQFRRPAGAAGPEGPGRSRPGPAAGRPDWPVRSAAPAAPDRR